MGHLAYLLGAYVRGVTNVDFQREDTRWHFTLNINPLFNYDDVLEKIVGMVHCELWPIDAPKLPEIDALRARVETLETALRDMRDELIEAAFCAESFPGSDNSANLDELAQKARAALDADAASSQEVDE